MLLGLFGGVGVGDLKASQQKVAYYLRKHQETKGTHNEKVSRALADREAAIRQIRDEILEVAALRED